MTDGAAVLLFVVFIFLFVAGFFALSPKSADASGTCQRGLWE